MNLVAGVALVLRDGVVLERPRRDAAVSDSRELAARDESARGSLAVPRAIGAARARRLAAHHEAGRAAVRDGIADRVAAAHHEPVLDGVRLTALDDDAAGLGAAPRLPGQTMPLLRADQLVAFVTHVADGGAEGEVGADHVAVVNGLRRSTGDRHAR